LHENEIGTEGAEYLAEALKSVKVLKIFTPPDLLFSTICHVKQFLTDTNHTQLEVE